jgi:hypothetical protein
MANTTWNPADKSSTLALTNGNLTATPTFTGFEGVRSIFSSATGKYYWEYIFTGATLNGGGITLGTTNLSSAGTADLGFATVNNGGTININAVFFANLASFIVGGVAGMALDLDNKRIWFRNGAAGQWNASGTANPATNTGGASLAFIGAGTAAYGVATSRNNGTAAAAITANFGDSAFVGVVPAGFTSGFPGTAVATGQTVRVMVLA